MQRPCPKYFFLILLWIAVLPQARSFAQADTLRYTRQEAEKIFLENNLPLLAERLNISQADARILQAKAWSNPVFSLGDIQLYNTPNTDESPPLFGNFWRNRTFTASIEQMVQTAGKRRKSIALEMRNKEQAEQTFTDMLLALKAEFRQHCAELYLLQEVSADRSYQLQEVAQLVNAQQALLQEGNISQAELFRLKGLQLSLQVELKGFRERISETQKDLKTLMNAPPGVFLVLTDPVLVSAQAIQALKQHSPEDLTALAEAHNAALAVARKGTEVSEAAFKLEKANAVPNVTFNLGYDRNGNNQLNFLGAGVGVELPVFNRNKGNIRAARLEVQKSMLMEKNKVNEVHNNVVRIWSDLSRSITLFEGIDTGYIERLHQMTAAITRNFREKNISLLQLLDFLESFRESKEQYYEALKDIATQKEELGYLTGQEL